MRAPSVVQARSSPQPDFNRRWSWKVGALRGGAGPAHPPLPAHPARPHRSLRTRAEPSLVLESGGLAQVERACSPCPCQPTRPAPPAQGSCRIGAGPDQTSGRSVPPPTAPPPPTGACCRRARPGGSGGQGAQGDRAGPSTAGGSSPSQYRRQQAVRLQASTVKRASAPARCPERCWSVDPGPRTGPRWCPVRRPRHPRHPASRACRGSEWAGS
jgi:hypothetical protein